MASFTAELHIDGTVLPLTHCAFGVQQAIYQRGRASTKVRYEPVHLVLDVPAGDFLLAWASAPHKRLPATMLFRDAAGGGAHESLRMAAAYCVSYREVFAAGNEQSGAYQAFLTLSDPDGWTLAAGESASRFVPPAPREHGLSGIVAALSGPASLPSPFVLMREGAEGVEGASADLIAKVAARRNLHFASTPDELRYLDYIGAEANVGGEKMDHITHERPTEQGSPVRRVSARHTA